MFHNTSSFYAHQNNEKKKNKKSQPAFMQNYALEMNLLLIIYSNHCLSFPV